MFVALILAVFLTEIENASVMSYFSLVCRNVIYFIIVASQAPRSKCVIFNRFELNATVGLNLTTSRRAITQKDDSLMPWDHR